MLFTHRKLAHNTEVIVLQVSWEVTMVLMEESLTLILPLRRQMAALGCSS